MPVLRSNKTDEPVESGPCCPTVARWEDNLGKRGLFVHGLQRQERRTDSGSGFHEVIDNPRSASCKSRYRGHVARPKVSFLENVSDERCKLTALQANRVASELGTIKRIARNTGDRVRSTETDFSAREAGEALINHPAANASFHWDQSNRHSDKCAHRNQKTDSR